MLVALAKAGRRKGFVLRCFHVEHGIRTEEESLGDAAAVRELCRKLEVPCRVVHIPPGRIATAARSRRIGIEAAARLFRHAAWNREVSRIGAERVLVAHTRDDLLETTLMRFLRGSGPAGLAAMPRSRGLILRPLLDVSRSQILAYLKEQGVSFRTDSTNADSLFLRNRIRNRLVPSLDELFPGWRSSVANLGETQRLTAEFLSLEAERRIPWEAASGAKGRRVYRVSQEAFFSQPEILREEGVFWAADRLGAGQPRRASVRRFTQNGCRSVDLGRIRLETGGDWITASSPVHCYSEESFSLLIKEPGIYTLKRYSLIVVCLRDGEELSGTTGTRESFRARLPLILRPSRPDDKICGANGVSRPKALAGRRPLEYTDSITVEDSLGVAAFISIGREKAAVIADRKREGLLFFCSQLRPGDERR
jgi:tRNA(Ile)-lysidine synthase